MSRRALVFALILVGCLAGAGAYVLHAVHRAGGHAAAPPITGTEPVLREPGDPLGPEPMLVFRRSAADRYDGALGTAPLGGRDAARLVPALRCERVHMTAGRGVCLAADRGVFTTYRAILFDDAARPRGELPLAGIPSRVQVAPNGRLAATTVFVSGHSYAAGTFSTRTSLIDLDARRWNVEDLETFTVLRDGRVIAAPDFNFWGVTFAPDGHTVYATLGTSGETLLVKGDLQTRTFTVLDEDVECPSLSPDGRRLAFKQRTRDASGAVAWRLSVLDLETGRRHPLAESRNVDDQAQWLDDGSILYGLPAAPGTGALMDAWIVPADGTGTPRLFLPRASSAGVARPGP